uniref:NAD_binding_6 domain-containing protein n=1 Tax=Heterorhabditis bacteriophora TaxID=37862 RepID=A0A1I7XRT8_HETBA
MNHDLVLVYHPNIRNEIAELGPQLTNDRTIKEVNMFQQRNASKRIPKMCEENIQRGVSGYNNHYPDMLGVFLAIGPESRVSTIFCQAKLGWLSVLARPHLFLY